MRNRSAEASRSFRLCRSGFVQLRVEGGPQLVEHALQIVRQCTRELHAPLIRWMCERQPRGVEERAIEMRHRAKVAGNPAVHAAVEGIADDGMADGAQVHADLVR